MTNQNPEQVARDKIDAQLADSGWAVQDNTAIDFHIGQGQAIRDHVTSILNFEKEDLDYSLLR